MAFFYYLSSIKDEGIEIIVTYTNIVFKVFLVSFVTTTMGQQ